jgi:hypothetical protein
MHAGRSPDAGGPGKKTLEPKMQPWVVRLGCKDKGRNTVVFCTLADRMLVWVGDVSESLVEQVGDLG